MWISKCCHTWAMPVSFSSLSQAAFFNSIQFFPTFFISSPESYFFPTTLGAFLFPFIAHPKAACGKCSSAICQNTNPCLFCVRTAMLAKHPRGVIINRCYQRCRRPWLWKPFVKNPVGSLRPRDTQSHWYTGACSFRYRVCFINLKMPVFVAFRLYWWICYVSKLCFIYVI